VVVAVVVEEATVLYHHQGGDCKSVDLYCNMGSNMDRYIIHHAPTKTSVHPNENIVTPTGRFCWSPDGHIFELKSVSENMTSENYINLFGIAYSYESYCKMYASNKEFLESFIQTHIGTTSLANRVLKGGLVALINDSNAPRGASGRSRDRQ
jgi:hypothetical protein